MDEAIEALEGCMAIIETLEEDRHDPRHYALIAALRWIAATIDDMSGCEAYHDAEAAGQGDNPEFA